MRKIHGLAVAFCAAVALYALPTVHGAANAFPAGGAMTGADARPAAASNLLTEVAKRRYYGWRYNWRNHGPRYAYRRPGFRYYYGGYWYARPYWAYPLYTPYRVAPRYRYYYYDDVMDDHVEWCMNRYRSYDPRSDTFLGYDGRRHACISPYD
jgi:hypothetical protein